MPELAFPRWIFSSMMEFALDLQRVVASWERTVGPDSPMQEALRNEAAEALAGANTIMLPIVDELTRLASEVAAAAATRAGEPIRTAADVARASRELQRRQSHRAEVNHEQ